MLAATINHASTNPEHAKTAALCPATFNSQPPSTPPMARPIDCVVLYTPAAAPFLVPGASFDTSDGCDASSTLKPRKYTNRMPATDHSVCGATPNNNWPISIRPMADTITIFI